MACFAALIYPLLAIAIDIAAKTNATAAKYSAHPANEYPPVNGANATAPRNTNGVTIAQIPLHDFLYAL